MFFGCVYGRDGVNHTDWTVDIDNSDCAIYDELMEDKLNDLALISVAHSQSESEHEFNLVKWVVAAVVAFIWLCIWGRAIWKHSMEKSKLYEASRETSPLLSRDLDYTIENNPLLQ